MNSQADDAIDDEIVTNLECGDTMENDAQQDMPHDKDATTLSEATVPFHILPLIVFSQFAGTSLWFAGNAVMSDLMKDFGIPDSALGYLTSSVQFGFILGSLVSAIFNLADRYLPTRVFLVSALLGAAANATIPYWGKTIPALVVLRLMTGVCLAGVYPVGMKVASDWYMKSVGRALGWLVGALVLGTAFPFLLRQIDQDWRLLIWETSMLAAVGGLLMGLLVPNGPFRKPSPSLDPRAAWIIFSEFPDLRAAALGYFGHMWEAYAFWTWCPVVWKAIIEQQETGWDPSLVTFCVISVGAIGCIIGGIVSQRVGSVHVAFWTLAVSGLCCLISPLLFYTPPALSLTVYLLWGAAVITDSPQYSSLVATAAPAEKKGTALTIVNCIGFAVTIGSIQLLGVPIQEKYLFLLLAPGPLLGLFFMKRLVQFSCRPNAAQTRTSSTASSDRENSPQEQD